MAFGDDDDTDGGGMRTGVILSVAFHVGVVAVGLVGLPFLTREPPEVEEFVMVVNPQIAELTAAPPPAPKKAETPKPPPAKEEAPAPTPPPQPKPTPTPPQKPEPVKEAPPKPAPPPPPPKAAEPPPAPKPPEPKAPEPPPPPPKKEEPPKPKPEEPKPKPKPEEPKPAPKKEEPPPKPAEPPKKAEPKPEPPKKAEAKPEPKKEPPKKEADPFDSLLNTVEQMKDRSAPPPETKTAEAKGSPKSTEAASNQVAQAPRISDIATASEKEMIRAHVQPHWFLDPGMQGIQNLFVEIRVQVAPDGTVQNARVVSSAPPGTERQFQAFAESARRAVLKSSPIPIPAGKYESFKDMVLVFRPEDAL